jgi:hypothetical protein
MPQFRPIQQSLFPELTGAFRESESTATLNQCVAGIDSELDAAYCIECLLYRM